MEEEYVISNSKKTKFLSKDTEGKNKWVSSINAADIFTWQKANAVIKNNLGKGSYKILVKDTKKEIRNNPNVSSSRIDKLLSEKGKGDKGQISTIEIIADGEYEDCENSSDIDLLSIVEILNNIGYNLDNEEKKLNNQLVRVSRAITDINHFMEMNTKRSASKRCQLDMFNTNLLVKRREIKNKLYYIDSIKKMIKGEISIIEPVENSYTPRELGWLFRGEDIPDFSEWWGDGRY